MTRHCFRKKVQLSQSLSDDGITRRIAREYGPLLEGNPGPLNATWFSDEAHFHVDGYINKQNVRFWASQNPRLTVVNQLHSERVTVWCALSSIEIFRVHRWYSHFRCLPHV